MRAWFCVVVGAAVGLIGGCAVGTRLPDPPAEGEAVDVAANPAVQQRRLQEAELAARTRLIRLYDHLQNGRYRRAARLVSERARRRLADGGTPEAVARKLNRAVHTDADPHHLDPVDFLLFERLARIEDGPAGRRDGGADTLDRQTIRVTGISGERRDVVLIREQGQWVLHRTMRIE